MSKEDLQIKEFNITGKGQDSHYYIEILDNSVIWLRLNCVGMSGQIIH